MAITATENGQRHYAMSRSGFDVSLTELAVGGQVQVQIGGVFEARGASHSIGYSGTYADLADAKIAGEKVLDGLIAAKQAIGAEWAKL